MCPGSRPAITNYWRLGGLKKFIVLRFLEARSPNTSCWLSGMRLSLISVMKNHPCLNQTLIVTVNPWCSWLTNEALHSLSCSHLELLPHLSVSQHGVSILEGHLLC
jgi:hypothetical protein